MNIIERDIVTMLFLFSYLFKLFIHCVDIFSLLTCISSIVLEECLRSFLREPVATGQFDSDSNRHADSLSRENWLSGNCQIVPNCANGIHPHVTALVSHGYRSRYLD